MRTPIRRFTFLVALLAIITAACGGGAATSPAPATSAAAAPTAAASKTPSIVSEAKIVIGASASQSWLPIQLAVKKGYFKDAGLPNLTFTTIDSAPAAATALAAGEVQFAGLAFERAALSTVAGKPVQCVVSIQDTPPSSLVISSKLDIKPGDWAALKGKTIGIVQGGWSEIFPKYLMQKAGVDPKDVKFTSTPNTATMLSALKSGNIDGFSGIEPAQRQAIIEGSAKMFFDLEDPANLKQFWPTPFQATCLQAKADYAKANPQVIAAVKTAIVRALKEFHANKQSALDLAASLAPTSDPKVREASITALINTWSNDGALTEAAIANVQKLLIDFGALKQALPYADLVYTGK